MEFEIENGVLVRYRGEEEHVVIPDGVSKIADEVFKDCTEIKSVVFPEGLEEIGESAFEACTALTEAKLPDGVDMMEYVKRLLDYKVAVVPGTAFMIDDSKECRYIRLNFSTPSDENIEKGVKIMGEVAKKFTK